MTLISEGGEKIYVEIAVTHLSTDEKRSLGMRLIEIKIDNEQDFSLISARHLSENDKRVELLNFNRMPITGDFSSECHVPANVFILNKNGSSRIKAMKWHQYEKIAQDIGPFYKLVAHDSIDIYIRELEKAYLNGLCVKNCFLCRYHGKPNRYQRSEEDFPIFCKFQKTCHHLNDAVNCKYYKPDKKVFRYET